MKTFIALHFMTMIVTGMGYNSSMEKCPDRYVGLETGCYYFSDQGENITWCQAFFICRNEMNGNLVEIESQQEQDNIRQYIITTADPAGKDGFWIGATDLLKKGEYRWMTSRNLLTYTAWYPYEPNNSFKHEDCAMIYKTMDYMWNDLGCDDVTFIPMRAICKVVPND